MPDFIRLFFDSKDFTAHGFCFLWRPGLLWSLVVSDVAIAIAYFSIPLAIAFFAFKRKDFEYKALAVFFSLFIFACGLTHLFSTIVIWQPVYPVLAVIKVFTAVISVITAILVWPLIPRALRMPSRRALLKLNQQLESEVFKHKNTQVQLERLTESLDKEVEARTEALRNSEESYAMAQRAAKIGSWEWDIATGQLHWSEQIEPMFGFKPGQFSKTYSAFLELIHPDDREKYLDSVFGSLNDGKEYYIEHRIVWPDGTVRWVVEQGDVFWDENEKPLRMLGIMQDITAQKTAEEEKLRFGEILEKSYNEIYIFDAATLRFIQVNDAARNNLGYSLNELQKMTPLDLKPDYSPETFARLLEPLRDGSQKYIVFETRHQRKDGSFYPIEVRLQLQAATQKPVFFAIIHDITQRQADNDKIKQLSDLYAALSQINHAIVYIANETELFTELCRISVHFGSLKMAWVGIKRESDQRIICITSAGVHQEYLDGIEISADERLSIGQGPTGIAFRDKKVVVANHFLDDELTKPWHDRGILAHWASSCAIPILRNNQSFAVLNVYSEITDYFNDEVIKLLSELGRDLTFALDTIDREAARKKAEEDLKLSAQVFEQSQEAIVICDERNKIISVNQAFTTITGYSTDEVIGKNPNVLSSGRQGPSFYQAMWQELKTEGYWQGEIWNRRKDGEIFPEWISISVVKDIKNKPLNYIAIFSDISQHKETEARIEHLAHYDPLTDLPNRILLKAHIDHELITATRKNTHFALLFLDLDHFKKINDTLGHSVGDKLLIEIARRLKSVVREEDTVSRLGGDEFNILLPGTEFKGAALVAEKIITAVSEPFQIEQNILHISLSVGISLFPENGANYETLYKNADTALYQSKEKGRNQYQFFTQEMQILTMRRMEIENNLRNAADKNELLLFYQPQMDVKTKQIVGAEALIRWRHPQWGMVSPAEFIPVAEDCGLIIPIGDWVLEQAIAQAKRWHDAGFESISIAVNLSLAQFNEGILYEKVKNTLEHFQLEARYLELELTESIAMQNTEVAIKITQQLAELGVQLSIDDFGTGYSSLSYLQSFALNKLKIDQSFSSNMVDNKETENIVNAIISMAKSLNLKTIAEGVETKEQLEMVVDKGCDQVQGFYYSKPVPADEFTELLNGRGFNKS